jgi:tetratricopeptide (TPR) repeat protein
LPGQPPLVPPTVPTAPTGRMADDRRLALAVGVLALALYAAGACRTIYVGDSGELTTAVFLLGIPHPSAYPLYVLLGKLWTLALPVGSVAFRMSLFSAACAAAAVALLFSLARRLGLGRPAALFGAGLLAVAPSFWGEANIQRVYALGALCLVAALHAAFAWERERTTARLAVVAFLCALGATNHTYMFVFAAAFAGAALAVEPGLLRRGRAIGAAAVAFAAGLLPYAYLPLRSRSDPALDWGDPETLDRFLAVLLRRDFWERRWLESAGDWLTIAGDFFGSFPVELTAGGAALALAGLALRGAPAERGGSRFRKTLLVLAVLGNVVAMGLHGSRSDLFIWHRYYIPAYLSAALLAAFGAQALLARVPPRMAWLLLAFPAYGCVTGWSEFDRSRYAVAEDYSRQLLAQLPPGAHLVASDDNILFVLLYLRYVEGQRPDVDLVAQGAQGSGDAPRAPLHFDPDREALYFTHHPNWNLPELAIVPRGLLFRVERRGSAAPLPALSSTLPRELAGENDPEVPKDYLTRNLIGEFHYMLALSAESAEPAIAAREFRAAAAAAPDNDVLFYNLGLIHLRAGRLEEALAAFSRSLEINPRHLASGSRPRAADRIAEVRAAMASGRAQAAH